MILPTWLSAILGVSCLVFGFYLLIVWYVKGKNNKSVNKETQGKPIITINSRDFINMDTERAKVFLDGFERIIKESKRGGRTEKDSMETKKDR